jgi:MOSC domain-containing protein YiiM
MKIESIAVSRHKGTRKKTVASVLLKENFGIEGDAHAGEWHRQVSFLAAESIEAARAKGLSVSFGDFAENFATRGVDWNTLPVGTRIAIGPKAVVEITQVGKECHKKCAIYYQAGDCIMPREGIFGRVLAAGPVQVGDAVKILPAQTGKPS